MTVTGTQREDGVPLAADDRHETGRRQRDEDEDGRDDDDRRQRLGPILRPYHVDDTVQRHTAPYRYGTGCQRRSYHGCRGRFD